MKFIKLTSYSNKEVLYLRPYSIRHIAVEYDYNRLPDTASNEAVKFLWFFTRIKKKYIKEYEKVAFTQLTIGEPNTERTCNANVVETPEEVFKLLEQV